MAWKKEVDVKFISRAFSGTLFRTKQMAYGIENKEPAVQRYISKWKNK